MWKTDRTEIKTWKKNQKEDDEEIQKSSEGSGTARAQAKPGGGRNKTGRSRIFI